MQKGKNPRTKKQLMKLTQKWVFMAKHGLSKHGFKDQKLVSCGRGANREERKREKKRKRKKKKRRRGREDQEVRNFEFCMELWIFGMETHLDYEFYEIWHGSLGLYDDYLA